MRRPTDDAYIDEDNFEIPDGGRVKVPLYLTDTVRFEDGRERFLRSPDAAARDGRTAARDDDRATFDAAAHQPGFRYASDAARAAVRDARAEMIRRAENAWRTPPQRDVTAARDAAEPDLGTRPEELMMRRHLFGAPGSRDPGDDPAETMRGHLGELRERVQRERDRAWNAYKDRTSNAWKTGGAQPQPAKVGPGPSGFIAAVETPDPAARARQIERQGERWRGGR